jgi:crotonobetainyl-CoA:carnitine CoA-transferase CaiB-like acyl-CoA transferase
MCRALKREDLIDDPWSMRLRNSVKFVSRGLRLGLTRPRLIIASRPMLGADNESILSELGYSAEEIQHLKVNRVLCQSCQLAT